MDKVKAKQLFYGSLTYIPLFKKGIGKFYFKSTGGTDSAEYCYSVWLRHLVNAYKSGLNTQPTKLAELGPGDSIGIGLASILTGVQNYFAFDLISFNNVEKTLALFEKLVLLLKAKTPIPYQDEYERINPRLDDYRFPATILTDKRLTENLSDQRLDEIRRAIKNMNNPVESLQTKVIQIAYIAPWYYYKGDLEGQLDMIISQSVLEYIPNVEDVLKKLLYWLKPDGYMSHQVDYKSLRSASTWNGHWQYTSFEWNIIKGKRPMIVNRMVHSQYLTIFKKLLLNIVLVNKVERQSAIHRFQLASSHQYITEEDMNTSGAFFLLKKEENSGSFPLS